MYWGIQAKHRNSKNQIKRNCGLSTNHGSKPKTVVQSNQEHILDQHFVAIRTSKKNALYDGVIWNMLLNHWIFEILQF